MISILIPSLREKLLRERITEFALTNPTTRYEIITVSPFEIKESNVIWIKDSAPFRGSVKATNQALGSATGEYVMYFSDDVSPTKDCLKNMTEFLKSNENGNINPFLGAFKMITIPNREIGPFGAYNRLYACYGAISKASLLKLNNKLFDNQFLYSWADIDLSLRVWELGGRVEICQNAIVIPKQEDDEIYKSHRNTFDKDFNIFLGKWHEKYGVGMERKDGVVNRRLK